MGSKALWFTVAAVISIASAHVEANPTPILAQRQSAIVDAIVPTASGQIGINPVTSDLGPVATYELENFAPGQAEITFDGSSYHYIEAHTGYLSIEDISTTSYTQGAVVTTTIQVAAATATSSASGQSVGDIGLVFDESIANSLQSTADSALSACSVVAGKKRDLLKRLDSVSCLIDAAVKASGQGGPLDAVMTDAFWEELVVSVAANAPEYLASAIAVINSQAQKNKALIILASIMVGIKVTKDGIAAVNIPAVGVGQPSGGADDNAPQCQSGQPVNKDSPICSDSDCQGSNDTAICTTGSNKGCACLLEGTMQPPQLGNQTWWDEEEFLYARFNATPTLLGTAEPSCFVNTDGNDFGGQPVADPASWCVCDIGGTSLIYATGSATASPCSFSAAPTATISPKITASSGGSVTSCRVSTLSGTGVGSGPYCTCNDNSMYQTTTYSSGSGVVTGCAATMTSSTASSTASSSAPTPTCNTPKQYSIDQGSLVDAGKQFCSNNNGQGLRSVPINPYSNALTGYQASGASSGGQLYMFAYLDKGCTSSTNLNQDDCNTAFQSIFDKCDVNQGQRQGGAASINCQWFNITAVDSCMGSTGSFENPGSCQVGNLPSYYTGWPLGTLPS